MVGPYADAPSGPTPPQLPAAASEISLVSHTFGMLTRTDPRPSLCKTEGSYSVQTRAHN